MDGKILPFRNNHCSYLFSFLQCRSLIMLTCVTNSRAVKSLVARCFPFALSIAFTSSPFCNVGLCTNQYFLFWYVINRQLKREYFEFLSYVSRYHSVFSVQDQKEMVEKWLSESLRFTCIFFRIITFFMKI